MKILTMWQTCYVFNYLNTESVFASELLGKASSGADHLVRPVITVWPGYVGWSRLSWFSPSSLSRLSSSFIMLSYLWSQSSLTTFVTLDIFILVTKILIVVLFTSSISSTTSMIIHQIHPSLAFLPFLMAIWSFGPYKTGYWICKCHICRQNMLMSKSRKKTL